MNVNMDGLRKTLMSSVNRLGRELESIKVDLSDYQFKDIAEAFDSVALQADTLGCVFSDSDEGFNVIGDEYDCMRLSEDDE